MTRCRRYGKIRSFIITKSNRCAASAAPATPAASAAPAAAQQGVHSGGDISSPPGDVRAIQKRLAGLQRAQMRNCTDAREEQIGELEYELDERKRKFRKYGHW